MAFLFGDETSAPFDSDALPLIRATVAYAVDVLDACEQIRARRAAIESRARLAERRYEEIQELGKRIADVLEVEADENEARAGLADLADRIRVMSGQQVADEVRAVRGELERYQRRATAEISEAGEQSVTALAELLAEHDLPGATGRLTIALDPGEDAYRADLRIRTGRGLEATFALAIPDDHLLSAPCRLADITGRARIGVPGRSLLRRRATVVKRNLGRLYLISLQHGAGHTKISLRESLEVDAPGVDIKLVADGEIELIPRAAGLEPRPAQEADSDRLRELESELLAACLPISGYRRRMLGARLDEQPVADLEEPEKVVSRVIAAVAPVAREVARRSDSHSELVLWEVTPGAKRARRSLARSELDRMIDRLPPTARAVLDPLGLGPEPERQPPPPPPPMPKERSGSEIDRGWTPPPTHRAESHP